MPARVKTASEPSRVSARVQAQPKAEPAAPKPTRGKRKAADDNDDAPAAKRGKAAAANEAAPAKKEKAAPKPKTLPKPKVYKDELNEIPTPPAKIRPAQNAFVFGNTDDGPQLGLGPTVTNISRPRLHAWIKEAIENGTLGAEKGAGLEQVCVGAMHSLAIDELGRIWSWGINDEGQLGRVTEGIAGVDKDELESTITQVEGLQIDDTETPFRAVQVAAGGSVSVALSEKGEVRCWGSFKWDGLFGFNSSTDAPMKQIVPQTIPGLETYRFVQVACGVNHVLALTTTGVILSWGNGEDGQLGRKILERRKRNALVPDRLHLRNITYIASGNNTCFAIDKDHVVYAWGLNGQKQTGVDPEDGGAENVIEHPTRIRALLPDELGGRHVTQIVSGEGHTLFLLNDGSVFGCGRTQDNQLGLAADHPALKTLENYCVPTPVHIRLPDAPTGQDMNPELPNYDAKDAAGPPSVKIVNLTANSRHNYAVSDEGHVYTWGWGSHHQLALGPDAEEQETPTIIRNTVINSGWKIKSAAAGAFHGVLLATFSPA